MVRDIDAGTATVTTLAPDASMAFWVSMKSLYLRFRPKDGT